MEAFVRITPEYGRTVFQFGDKQFEEQKVFYADSNFFDFFGYELMYGDPQTLLTSPGSIVLTMQLAEKYFGPSSSWAESPVGKTLHVNGSYDFEVTGIAEDPPENTHFRFHALTSFSTFLTFADPTDQWEWNDFYTYVRLKEPVDLGLFNEKLVAFADRHINKSGKRTEYKVHYGIQPIEEIHLHSDLGYEAEANGSARTVNIIMIGLQ